MKFFTKMSFWNKVRALIALCGPGTEVFLILKDVNENFQIGLAVIGAIGYAIAVVMEDKDNNNIVDIFENKAQL